MILKEIKRASLEPEIPEEFKLTEDLIISPVKVTPLLKVLQRQAVDINFIY